MASSDGSFNSNQGDHSDLSDDYTPPPSAPNKPKQIAVKKMKMNDGNAAPIAPSALSDSGKTKKKKKKDDGDDMAIADSQSRASKYQKYTQLEHVLNRPDTYMGSIQKTEQLMYVFDESKKKIVWKPVRVTMGFYKIFDEILVNAADNKQRDPSMDKIEVVIDRVENRISVMNTGKGIPVEIHPKEKVYVPEMIFGHFLTSSNYDDEEEKVVGGRNGYGAKLANAFSGEFTVETFDSQHKKRYTQTWRNNMSLREDPQIQHCANKKDYTKITFVPDLKRLDMDRIDDDIMSLLVKRVYDVAACNTGVKVTLNGEAVPIKSFKDYVKLYFPDAGEGESKPFVHERVNDRWEIAIAQSEGQPVQVSFVNSIATIKGGKHVEHVANKVAKHLKDDAMKKMGKGGLDIKDFQVKNHMWIFVNSLIVNPAFDSQTKETLTTPMTKFGSQCDVSEDTLKKISKKTGVVEAVVRWAAYKSKETVEKGVSGKKKARIQVPKLDDANDAGTKNSEDCVLILTEGDSAKSLAMSGIAVVGRDKFGAFPLKGKLLNVRDATHKAIKDNDEIQHIAQILGLQHGEDYTQSVKSLRYGHLMIMTDQDHDGSHIKGLIINYLHHFWPSLVRRPGFLLEFVTPIVKAKRGKETVPFFTIPEFEKWKEGHAHEKGWTFKYYKGLGTSTSVEAKEYFSRLNKHQIEFRYTDTKEDELIDMAFAKKKANLRKDWILQHKPGTFVDHSKSQLPYADFINKELILFSMADCERSIPSLVDGFKPGQRKIMYACFKRNLTKEFKVAQLAGYVAEHSAYHHGEASLMSTIIGMAQNFVGSNNVNLLHPEGAFGTRRLGGKDAASPRYIYTFLSSPARLLFHPLDDPLLNYLEDDGVPIEPEWYLPIIPMALVNGVEGIGTGWSTRVPCYNPRDIVKSLFVLMDTGEGTQLEPMTPWYHNFQGTIEPVIGPVGSSTAGKRSGGGRKSSKKDESTDQDAVDEESCSSVAMSADGGDDLNDDDDDDGDIQVAPTGDLALAKAQPGGEHVLKGYQFRGLWKRTGPTEVQITELPIGTWTQSYKEYLETLIAAAESSNINNSSISASSSGSVSASSSGRKKGGGAGGKDTTTSSSGQKKKQTAAGHVGERVRLKQFKEYHTDHKVEFHLIFSSPDILDAITATPGDFEKYFKLTSTVSVTNMHLFDAKGKIRKYSSPESIIREFYPLRLEFYGKRKEHLLKKINEELLQLSNRARFVLAIIKGELQVNNRKKKDIVDELRREKYDPVPPNKDKKNNIKAAGQEEDKDEDEDGDDRGEDVAITPNSSKQGAVGNAGGAEGLRDYDYLLSMQIYNLTWEKVQKLLNDKELKEADLRQLAAKTPKDLWKEDLQALLAGLDIWEEERRQFIEGEGAPKPKRSKGPKVGGDVSSAAKKRKRVEEDEDDDDDGDWMVKSTAGQKRSLTASANPYAASSARGGSAPQKKISVKPSVKTTLSASQRGTGRT